MLNGILLRRIRYSDTSLILTWFTDLHGKIKTMAKGALRQKSAFAGKLDLFFHCDLLLSFSRKTELHLLREVSIKTTLRTDPNGLPENLCGLLFCRTGRKVTELDHPVPEIYQLLLRALGYLDRQKPDTRGVLFFESELCKCLGLYTPDMHSAADKLVEAYGRLPKARAALISRF